MTYKNRRLVLMTTVLGVAFNFLPASPRAATLDQTEAPRGTDGAPGEIQSPRGRVQVTVDDTQAPRGAQARQDEFQAPRGEANATPDDTEKP